MPDCKKTDQLFSWSGNLIWRAINDGGADACLILL